MTNLSEKLDRLKLLPSWYVSSFALLMTSLIGLLDYLVGEEMDLSVLYVPVVALVCWLVNLRTAVLLSLICSIIWLIDDWLSPDVPLPAFVHYWESAIRFLSFWILAVVLSHLQQALERESASSRSDALTGLANIRAFVEHAERELAECRRSGAPLTVVFLDCDHFKQVNDQFGHPQGDALLTQMSNVIRDNIRENDLAARMGGDEFAILCRNTSEDDAIPFGDRLAKQLNQCMRDGEWAVTFSIGIATFISPPESVADLIREADNLMYAVKHASRDGVLHQTINGDGQST
jgi:diguanylate cyclase (GGDEF)-like protein